MKIARGRVEKCPLEGKKRSTTCLSFPFETYGMSKIDFDDLDPI